MFDLDESIRKGLDIHIINDAEVMNRLFNGYILSWVPISCETKRVVLSMPSSADVADTSDYNPSHCIGKSLHELWNALPGCASDRDQSTKVLKVLYGLLDYMIKKEKDEECARLEEVYQ